MKGTNFFEFVAMCFIAFGIALVTVITAALCVGATALLMYPLFVLMQLLFARLHIPADWNLNLSFLVCFAVAGLLTVALHEVPGKIRTWWEHKTANRNAANRDDAIPACIFLSIIPAFLVWLLLEQIGLPDYLTCVINSTGGFIGIYIPTRNAMHENVFGLIDFFALWLFMFPITRRVVKKLSKPFLMNYEAYSASCAKDADAVRRETTQTQHKKTIIR